jgi:hypothetical protein
MTYDEFECLVTESPLSECERELFIAALYGADSLMLRLTEIAETGVRHFDPDQYRPLLLRDVRALGRTVDELANEFESYKGGQIRQRYSDLCGRAPKSAEERATWQPRLLRETERKWLAALEKRQRGERFDSPIVERLTKKIRDLSIGE